ncbi:MAG: ABC transporter permease [Oscillospiraceae bacterium]|jgi:ribose transport system permease protein|nr:ABC transporter permease [Oscillospiraceae bacterium]
MERNIAARIFRRATLSRDFWLVIVLVAVIAVFTSINRLYMSFNNIKNIMFSVSVSGVMMVGIATLLISGNMDLSAGAVGCFATIVGALLMNAGVPWGLGVLATAAVGALCGFINVLMAYKLGIMPFIGTLGVSFVWQGLANQITHNAAVHIENESFWKLGAGKVFEIPMVFLYVVILCVLYGLLLKYTKLGRRVYICGGNRSAARLAGINNERVGAMMMINCSVLASLAGIILASRMHEITPTNLQTTSTMSAITAALLGGVAFMGGIGTMKGAFIGLLLLNAFKNGLDMLGMDAYWQIIANGLLLITAIIVDYVNQRSLSNRLKQKLND